MYGTYIYNISALWYYIILPAVVTEPASYLANTSKQKVKIANRQLSLTMQLQPVFE